MKKAMITAVMLGVTLGLWAPPAEAYACGRFQWTVVKKVHEPERLLVDAPTYSKWDDEDWVLVIGDSSVFGHNKPTFRYYISKQKWNSTPTGKCSVALGFGSSKDAAIKRGPRV